MREKHTFLGEKSPIDKMIFLEKKPIQKIRKKNFYNKKKTFGKKVWKKKTLNRSLNVNPLGKKPFKEKKKLFV